MCVKFKYELAKNRVDVYVDENLFGYIKYDSISCSERFFVWERNYIRSMSRVDFISISDEMYNFKVRMNKNG